MPSIAATQLRLTASNIGLGAVWVSSFDVDKQKELFPEMQFCPFFPQYEKLDVLKYAMPAGYPYIQHILSC